MHTQNSSGGTVQTLVPELTARLRPFGLVVVAQAGSVLQIRNPAGDDAATEARGRALSPGMKQLVTAVEHDGELWWAWVWTSRSGPPEIEPMVPVGDVDEATRRITNVLRVDGHMGRPR